MLCKMYSRGCKKRWNKKVTLKSFTKFEAGTKIRQSKIFVFKDLQICLRECENCFDCLLHKGSRDISEKLFNVCSWTLRKKKVQDQF